jgi:hypothetical protein
MSPVHVRLGAATAKVAIQQVGCDRQAVSTVGGGDTKAPLAAGADTVLLHEPLHTLLADADALSMQLAARCAASRKLRDWPHTRHEYAPGFSIAACRSESSRQSGFATLSNELCKRSSEP